MAGQGVATLLKPSNSANCQIYILEGYEYERRRKNMEIIQVYL